MDRQYLLAVFSDEHDLLQTIRRARKHAYSIYDVYTPYGVHGIEDAMGIKPSYLTYICFAFALIGVLAAILGQFWIGTIDWPLNVGGKPFNSLPAYLPVTFEMLVLFGGVGVVLSFFIITRLHPGKKVKLVYPGVTDNLFVLFLEIRDTSFDFQTIQNICEQNNVMGIKQVAGETV